MVSRTPSSKPVAPPPPLAERMAASLFCVSAVCAPLALGSTGPFARLTLESSMALAATVWAISGQRRPWALVLPTAVAGVMLLQLLPLPDGILVNVAPVSAGRWKAAREGMPVTWATASVTPAATAVALQRLVIWLSSIVALVNLARKGMYRRWMYTSLAVAGVLIWTAGLLFPVDVKERLVLGFFKAGGPIEFWKTTERGPLQTAGFSFLDWVTVGSQRYQADGSLAGNGFGSFIYSNHFANALCITLPAVWVLWLFYTKNRLPGFVRFGLLLASMAGGVWTAGVMATSRAGSASLVFAALVYLSLIAESRWLRWAAGGTAGAIMAGLLGFVGGIQGPFSAVMRLLPAPLAESLARLLVDTRVMAAHVAGRMFLASPLLGIGLGAYGDLYPAFVGSDHVLYFAHNDYAQLLAEVGLLGGAVTAWIAWALGSRFWRFCNERPPVNRAIDAGAWAALAGTAAHSVFDWNMHAPANAFLACMVFALCMTSVAPRKETAHAMPPRWLRFMATSIFIVACLQALPWLARAALSDHAMDGLRKATTQARVAAKDPTKPSAGPALAAAIENGEKAARFDPANWRLAVLLGEASLHLAEESEAIDAAETRRSAAAQWFRVARRASAATRGLPEPLPANKP